MTPAEYEWTVEMLEEAYRRGSIGKITFRRRASRLGFQKIHEWLSELDAQRAAPVAEKREVTS